MGQVVWFEGQRVNRTERAWGTFRALMFHYRRVLLGAQSGMA